MQIIFLIRFSYFILEFVKGKGLGLPCQRCSKRPARSRDLSCNVQHEGSSKNQQKCETCTRVSRVDSYNLQLTFNLIRHLRTLSPSRPTSQGWQKKRLEILVCNSPLKMETLEVKVSAANLFIDVFVTIWWVLKLSSTYHKSLCIYNEKQCCALAVLWNPVITSLVITEIWQSSLKHNLLNWNQLW